MKRYILVITLLASVGVCRGNSIGDSRAKKIAKSLPVKPTLEKPLVEKPTFANKYLQELKTHGTAPFFLTSVLTLYTSEYLYNKNYDHVHTIATSALIAPLLQRFAVYPALEMGRLTSHPEAKDSDELFERVSFSKSSIRPTVTGLGTFAVSSLGLLSLAEKLVGNNPSALKTAGCVAAGLMIPALLVKMDEWAEESSEIEKKDEKVQPVKKPRIKQN